MEPTPTRCTDGFAHAWRLATGWAMAMGKRVPFTLTAKLSDGRVVPVEYCKNPGCSAQRPQAVAPEAVGMAVSGPV